MGSKIVMAMVLGLGLALIPASLPAQEFNEQDCTNGAALITRLVVNRDKGISEDETRKVVASAHLGGTRKQNQHTRALTQKLITLIYAVPDSTAPELIDAFNSSGCTGDLPGGVSKARTWYSVGSNFPISKEIKCYIAMDTPAQVIEQAGGIHVAGNSITEKDNGEVDVTYLTHIEDTPQDTLIMFRDRKACLAFIAAKKKKDQEEKEQETRELEKYN